MFSSSLRPRTLVDRKANLSVVKKKTTWTRQAAISRASSRGAETLSSLTADSPLQELSSSFKDSKDSFKPTSVRQSSAI